MRPGADACTDRVGGADARTKSLADAGAYLFAELRAESSAEFLTIAVAYVVTELRAESSAEFRTIAVSYVSAELNADVGPDLRADVSAEPRANAGPDRALQRLLVEWVQQRGFERPLRVRRDDTRRPADLRLGPQHALPLLRRELRRRPLRALE